MISQEEANVLMSESVMQKYRGPGEGYVSLSWLWHNVPESRDAIKSFFDRNTVIAVHPWYSIYMRTVMTTKLRPEMERKHGSYDNYFERMKAFVHSADDSGDLILLYYSKKYLSDTIRMLGELRNAVLVPTIQRSPKISETSMGCTEEQFYEFIKQVFKKGKMCGEWYGERGCVSVVKGKMEGLNFELMQDLTYPTIGEYKGEADVQRLERGYKGLFG